MEIPEEYQQLCKDLAKVLITFNHDHGWMKEQDIHNQKTIYSFVGKVSMADHEMSDINFHWESGRHGAVEGRISIETTIRVKTKIDE